MSRLLSSIPRKFWLIGAIIFIALLPLGIEDSFIRHLIIIAMIYGIVASNWDLTLGYGGVFNFGHLAFFGIGAYGSAILSKTVGLSPVLSIPIGGCIAVVAAAIVCLPVLRLRGIYVILVTFGFSQLVSQVIVSQADLTGGAVGMTFLPAIKLGDYNFARDGKIGYYYTTLFLLVLSTFILTKFTKSSTGLALMALRDQEDYALSRGVSIVRTRLFSLCLSAFFTGAAGALFATYLRVVSPEIFGFGILSLTLSMLLVGGASTLIGPIIAAFGLTFISEAMVGIGAWRHILIAGMIIVVVVLFPGGLYSAFAKIRNHLTGANT